MKSVSLISRRDDLSRAAFRRYYEDIHCWLGMKYFPFTRYTRNHLVATPAGVDFDCLSEFGMDPDFDGGDIMRSRSRALMLNDELKFMNPERIRVAAVREQVLLDTSTEASATEISRYLLLFQCTDSDRRQFKAKVESTAREMVAETPQISHASLDLVAEPDTRFPYDALLWLTMSQESATSLPKPGELPGLLAVATVSTHATPEAILRQHFEAYLP